MLRRRLLPFASAALALAIAPVALAQQARKRDAMRVGADPLAADLARDLLRGYGRDTGLAAQLEIAPSSRLLQAIEAGEMDVALTLAPEPEAALEKQGLAHDRRHLASASLVLAGPADGGVAAGRDVLAALREIATIGAPFVSRADGSGLHLAEQGLWRAAAIAPVAPWYRNVADGDLLEDARAQRAYVVIDRRGGLAPVGRRNPYGVVVDGDSRLDVPVHILRSFRSPHPAGKLFVRWVSSGQGARTVAGQRRLKPAAR